MLTPTILNSHTVQTLKKEISKYNKIIRVSGYSKMKKADLVNLMMKHSDKFQHIKHAKTPTPKPRKITSKAGKTSKQKPIPAPRKFKPKPIPAPRPPVKITPSIIKEQLEEYEELKKEEKKFNPLYIYPDSKVKDYLKKNIIDRILVNKGLKFSDFDIEIVPKDGKEKTMRPTIISFKGSFDFKEAERKKKEKEDKEKKRIQSELEFFKEENKKLKNMTQKERDETLLDKFKTTDIGDSEEWYLVKQYASKKTFTDILDNHRDFLKDEKDFDEKQLKKFGIKAVRKLTIEELNNVYPTEEIEKREKAPKEEVKQKKGLFLGQKYKYGDGVDKEGKSLSKIFEIVKLGENRFTIFRKGAGKISLTYTPENLKNAIKSDAPKKEKSLADYIRGDFKNKGVNTDTFELGDIEEDLKKLSKSEREKMLSFYKNKLSKSDSIKKFNSETKKKYNKEKKFTGSINKYETYLYLINQK